MAQALWGQAAASLVSAQLAKRVKKRTVGLVTGAVLTVLGVEGNGVETTARLLQEDGILTPTQYWAAKGIRKGGKKSQNTPCKWCKTTIAKILTLREYTGTLINFKTYSKKLYQ